MRNEGEPQCSKKTKQDQQSTQHTSAETHIRHEPLIEIVELQDCDNPTVVVEDGFLSSGLILKLVQHEHAPGVAHEGGPGIPVPADWDLLKHDEQTTKVQACGHIGGKHCIGCIHVRCHSSHCVGQHNADHGGQEVADSEDDEATLQFHSPEDRQAEDQAGKDAKDSFLNELGNVVGDCCVQAIRPLAIEKGPFQSQRGNIGRSAIATKSAEEEEHSGSTLNALRVLLATNAPVERKGQQGHEDLVSKARP
mmetsp:Transcript_71258/g.170197  ORF Transcript_71258/g.170197 Transcript_71258/m.170197 type:complete len:251 (+) Transcript_71258:209-961(+)